MTFLALGSLSAANLGFLQSTMYGPRLLVKANPRSARLPLPVRVKQAIYSALFIDQKKLKTSDRYVTPVRGSSCSATRRINSLAVDKIGKNLYATSNVGFYRIPIATGDRELLAPMNCTGACEVELNSDNAYISETEGGRKAI